MDFPNNTELGAQIISTTILSLNKRFVFAETHRVTKAGSK